MVKGRRGLADDGSTVAAHSARGEGQRGPSFCSFSAHFKLGEGIGGGTPPHGGLEYLLISDHRRVANREGV